MFIQVYLKLISFTKYILISKIWMDKWQMILAYLEQVARKGKRRINRMIKVKKKKKKSW